MKNHLDKRNNILNKKLMESWGYKKEGLNNEHPSDDVAKYLEKRYLERTPKEEEMWAAIAKFSDKKAFEMLQAVKPDIDVDAMTTGTIDWRTFNKERKSWGTIDDYLDSLEDPLTDDDDWGYEQDADY